MGMTRRIYLCVTGMSQPAAGRAAIKHSGQANMFGELGMKKLLLTGFTLAALAFGGPALAADMPTKAVPPPFSWTGWHVGVNGGGAWGHSHDPTTTVFSPTGYFAAS